MIPDFKKKYLSIFAILRHAIIIAELISSAPFQVLIFDFLYSYFTSRSSESYAHVRARARDSVVIECNGT